MKKKELFENIKSIPSFIFSFILVIAFFAWWSTVYNYTLISAQFLFLFSALLGIPILFFLYKKGFDDLLKNISFSPLIIGFVLCVSSLLFLSINYIPIGESKIKDYKILDAYHIQSNNKKKHFVKIKWRKEIIKLRIFLKENESLTGKKKIRLETRRGLLGFEVIKNRELL